MKTATNWSDRVRLHAGADLRQAAAQSHVWLTKRNRPNRVGLVDLWHDARNADWRRLLPKKQWVEGRESHTGQTTAILFVGSHRMLPYCSDLIFGKGNWQRVPATGYSSRIADFAILDIPFARGHNDSHWTIRTPPWVRVELLISEKWESTLDLLPLKQRKRIARHLRRFAYQTSCSTGVQSIRSFRQDFLVPAARQRFGESAIVSSEGSLVRECRNMIRLDLVYEKTVVASNLLSIEGNRLRISKGAPALGMDELKGRMDVLDYFSLLFAQKAGLKVLDFGLCRANLDDGPLRYKAKWGTTLAPAGGLKANTRISAQRDNPLTRSILRRNRFLELDGDGFVLKMLADTPDCRKGLPSLVARAAAVGVGRIDLFEADSKTADELASTYRIEVNALPFKPG